MKPVIYINGKFFDRETAMINVYDHGFLYGDGVFEGIRTYGGKAFKLKAHIDRLYDSARALCLEVPMTPEKMMDAVAETVDKSGIKEGYIRLIVTRGVGSLGLDPNKAHSPQIIIICDTISLYPSEFYENGLQIVTASTIRNHPAALNPRIKSLNYLNNILAKIEGSLAGCVEALMLNHKGEVAECTGDNIFLVKNKKILTPDINAGILDGITRNVVIDLARDADYKLAEMTLTRHDVYTADEVFLTGTAAELIPVVKIDARVIGDGKPGPVFRDIRERFRALVKAH